MEYYLSCKIKIPAGVNKLGFYQRDNEGGEAQYTAAVWKPVAELSSTQRKAQCKNRVLVKIFVYIYICKHTERVGDSADCLPLNPRSTGETLHSNAYVAFQRKISNSTFL